MSAGTWRILEAVSVAFFGVCTSLFLDLHHIAHVSHSPSYKQDRTVLSAC